MRKIKILSTALAVATLLSSMAMSACVNNGGGTTQSGRTADYTLTFYRSTSSTQSEGADDNRVKQALEDKYYEDTGRSVKLEMKIYSGNDLGTQVDINYPKTKTDLECVSHYLADGDGSAISKYAKEAGATVELSQLLETYGQNILAAIRENDVGHYGERAAWFNCDGTWGMNAIPGVSEQSSFAILLRRDMVEAVEEITGLDPDEYDVAEEGYKNMTFNEFYKLMYAIKQNIEGIRYPVTGAPWDIGRVIGSAFGVDSFNNGYDAEGNYVPSQMQENFDLYLQTMWHWAKDGIWEKDSAVNSDDNRLTAFVAGQAACYIAYPEINNLITVARKAVAANVGSEYMVIAPLATSTNFDTYNYLYTESINVNSLTVEGADRQVIGNLSQNRSFYGLILPYMNKNPERYVQFIDWLYSDVENYELAKYGIKGVHWDEGEDKTIGGVTYKTWKYPDAYASEYAKNGVPYTGVWEILENINVSNRLSSNYNTQETKWYVAVTKEFPTYTSGVQGIWEAEIPRSLNHEAGYIGEYIEGVRGKAWAGIYGGANKDQTPAALLAEYTAKMKTVAPNYLAYLNEEHSEAKAWFDEKFGQ